MIDVRGLPPWGGLATPSGEEAARITVAGIGYDGSAVYRAGAANAPAALRRLSGVMPPIDERGRSFADRTMNDIGDLDMGLSVETGWRRIADRLAALPAKTFLTVLGGDHTVAVPAIAAQARRHPGLVVLWVDAHPDLNDVSRGGRWTVGCALRRALEAADLAAEDVVLAGCRDFDPAEVAWIDAHQMTMATAADMETDLAGAAARLLRVTAGRPIHLSFDIDVLDPAHAPGTELPVAAGLTTRQALTFLAAIAAGGKLVGLDLCEVAPELDPSGITGLAALKLVFETWALLADG